MSEKIDIPELLENYKEIKDYFISCVEKYTKRCEFYKNAVKICNNIGIEYKDVLDKETEKNDKAKKIPEIKISEIDLAEKVFEAKPKQEDEKTNSDTAESDAKEEIKVSKETQTNKPELKEVELAPKSSFVKKNIKEYKTTPNIELEDDTELGNISAIKPDNSCFKDFVYSGGHYIDTFHRESKKALKKHDKKFVINSNICKENEYIKLDEYDDWIGFTTNNPNNSNNKYESYYVVDKNNKNEKEKKLYCIKITCQIKPPLKNITYGTIPDDWEIPVPDNKLMSDSYKEYLKDGSLVTRVYNDMNYEMRDFIKSGLRNLILYNSTEQFINRLKTLIKTNKYFFKTDIIGAYYNIQYDKIIKVLKDNNDICSHVESYLLGFYDFIKSKEDNRNYLYITNYSPLLFAVFLKRIIGNKINFISRYDDIILYSNNLDKLKTEFNTVADIFKQHGLYLNKKKSALYNTDVNSIFILKNIINIPASGKLDEITKNILKEYRKNHEYIKIACDDKEHIIEKALKN